MNQKAITKAQLKPYLKLVKRRIKRNKENAAWHNLDARWEVLVDRAQGIVNKYLKGKPMVRWERLAAQQVVKLAQEVKPREVVEVTAGWRRGMSDRPSRPCSSPTSARRRNGRFASARSGG